MAGQHRGEIVAEAVRKSGVKLSRLYTALEISRPTLYRRFEDPNLDFAFIKRVGELIYHDFSQEFKELAKSEPQSPEPIKAYTLDNLDDCKDKLLHVYSLYVDMVERYNTLLNARSKKS